MVQIIPAILEENKAAFEEKLKRLFGLIDAIQVDVIDGVFAPTKTITPKDLADINTSIKFDYQLMVDEPINWLEDCQTPQARAVYGQVEKMSDPAAFIGKCQFLGFQTGLALDIGTPLEKIADYIWDLDSLLLMSVKAGSQKQEFDERVLAKIEQARKLRDDLPLIIDGGLDVPQIKRCIAAEWAEEINEDDLKRNFMDIQFVVGSHLLGADDIEKKLLNVQHLKEE